MEKQFVVFKLLNEEYGIDILIVEEVVKLGEIYSIPESLDYLKGVINLRGEIIPLIDLKLKIGFPSEIEESSKIIILNLDEQRIGLIVDEVTGVIKIEEENIDPPPPTIPSALVNYIYGIAKINNRIIILLNIKNLLSTEEKISIKEAISKIKT